jgi:tetratricopeptide (TPR) repeat protein
MSHAPRLLVAAAAMLALTPTVVAPVHVLAAQPASQKKPDQMMGDELFAAYVGGGDQVLAAAFPTQARFEEFRKDFMDRVLSKWETTEPRTTMQNLFMLEVAIAALNKGYFMWADFVKQCSVFLRGRAEPPGANPSFDAFEIAWHKTAAALLAGRRRPDLLATEVIRPLGRRMAPEQPSIGAIVLVDPWIAVARGFAEEGLTIEEPKKLSKEGEAALERYREAAQFESTRAEAAVRSGRLLIRMTRPAEALVVLDAFDDRWTTDGVFRFWRRLLRGKALDALDRPDEAMRAYDDALRIAPTAHSPRVGMMAVEFKRNRIDAAETLAAALRTAADPVVDPWWTYDHGDWRFFPARLEALKAMVGR